MILLIVKTYLYLGLIWAIVLTGPYLLKAIKGHKTGQLAFDNTMGVLLFLMFFVSWIAWPWSLKNNISCLRDLFRREDKSDD